MNIMKSARSFRFFMNIYPPYFFTRTRIKYVSKDFKEVVVVLKRSLLTRNFVGTTFGGSLYSAADPFFMLMLIRIMGIKEYIIWDQDAKIEFLKPVKSHLTLRFLISDANLKAIEEDIIRDGLSRPHFVVEGKDNEGKVCVRVDKGIYIRRK